MTTRASHRVIVRQGDKDKNLLSISKDKKGNIFLQLMTVSSSIDPPSASSIHNRNDELIEERITIHPPRIEFGSDDFTSTLNCHLRKNIDTGKPSPTKQLSKAIINKKGFAFLFIRRCPLLGGPKSEHDATRASKLIDLGGYNPVMLTLIFAVYVGHRDAPLETPPIQGLDYSLDHFVIGDLRFLIHKSYITTPTTYHGLRFSGLEITKSNLDEELKDRFINGLNIAECIFVFRYFREATFEQYSEFLRTEHKHDPFSVFMIDTRSYIGNADLNGPGYLRHLEKIRPLVS